MTPSSGSCEVGWSSSSSQGRGEESPDLETETQRYLQRDRPTRSCDAEAPEGTGDVVVPAGMEDDTLPIEDERVVYLTEGKARRMLENWAYANAHKQGKGFARPKTGSKRKEKSREWLCSLPTRKLQALVNDVLPDSEDRQYRIGVAPSKKKIVEKSNEWDGRSRFVMFTFHHPAWVFNLPRDGCGREITDVEQLERHFKNDHQHAFFYFGKTSQHGASRDGVSNVSP